MRVLVVSQYFWPESFRINDVVTLLEEEGCAVTVLTGQPNYPSGSVAPGYRWFGLGRDRAAHKRTIVRVPLIPRGKGRALGLLLNYWSFVVSATVLGPWLLRGQRYDVVFVFAVSPIIQALPAIWLKLLKRASLIIWVQDLWPESLEVTGFVRNQTILKLVGQLTRWIYRRSDLVLGQSRSFVKAIREMEPSATVEYHPTPGDLVATDEPGQPLLVLPPGFNIVFAGNLGAAQALPTIVEAAAALMDHGDIRFILVGDGSRKDWLEAEIGRRRLHNVVLAGRYPPDAMGPILRQASVLLVTLNRSEAMAKTIPAKISSYLAAGRPIIAALDGEGGEVVREAGAGIACAAEAPEALAAAVLRLYSTEPSVLEEMGRSGRTFFENHFEPRGLARRLVELFKAVRGQREKHQST
jgi:glycosyltransferase involved in cell wall biosynthesis